MGRRARGSPSSGQMCTTCTLGIAVACPAIAFAMVGWSVSTDPVDSRLRVVRNDAVTDPKVHLLHAWRNQWTHGSIQCTHGATSEIEMAATSGNEEVPLAWAGPPRTPRPTAWQPDSDVLVDTRTGYAHGIRARDTTSVRCRPRIACANLPARPEPGSFYARAGRADAARRGEPSVETCASTR